MIIKRFFSAESSRRLFSDILKENSGTILALGAIGSGSFGIGFYVNQMRVFEEKLNAVKMEAKKDSIITEERARKDTLVAEERAKREVMEAKKEALELLYNIFTHARRVQGCQEETDGSKRQNC